MEHLQYICNYTYIYIYILFYNDLYEIHWISYVYNWTPSNSMEQSIPPKTHPFDFNVEPLLTVGQLHFLTGWGFNKLDQVDGLLPSTDWRNRKKALMAAMGFSNLKQSYRRFLHAVQAPNIPTVTVTVSFQQLSAKVIFTVRDSKVCTKVLWSEPQGWGPIQGDRKLM